MEHRGDHGDPGPARSSRAQRRVQCREATLAVALQDLLPKPLLHVGVDTLLAAMPPSSAGIAVADEGSVAVAGDLRRLELACYAGLAVMASSGAGLIIDEVFLTGQTSQQRLASALENVPTM